MARSRQHRRTHGMTAVAGVVCCLGLGLGAAGCAGGDAVAQGPPAGDPVQVLRTAADALVEAGTSQTRTSLEMAAGGTRVTIRGEGVYDYRRRLGRLNVRLPQDPAGAADRRPITELLAPGALYMKNRGAGVPADKWVRVDTATLSDGNLVTGGATDPFAAAEVLRGTRSAEFVGRTEVAGARVRHYRGTADLDAASQAASEVNRGPLGAAAKGFATARVPFDVYLDDEGRIRKIRHRFSFVNGERHEPVAVASTTLLYDFGAPADVRLPADEDIYAGRIAQE
ncbi:hypothetical protein OG986_15315 [Streptomyces cellulosae]|uniref:hypothetical protein n=2 Tax=unclassified Streptomyces TaxID=2593676 RepID=UPI0004772084|nr:hypothetical protein [Streptomyces sp. SID4956]MYW55031.1 hypothetical protein [Streptomyces sp. SID8376]THC56609.1 hypothetical protein E7X38_14005 [Streptomyces sp. Akac8]WSB55088.1 hypothetical protein OG880_15295 [Streptomyces cellulosae]WTB70130.1 hypothetical protein OIE90_15395 [Streptomyces cellulosae]